MFNHFFSEHTLTFREKLSRAILCPGHPWSCCVNNYISLVYPFFKKNKIVLKPPCIFLMLSNLFIIQIKYMFLYSFSMFLHHLFLSHITQTDLERV